MPYSYSSMRTDVYAVRREVLYALRRQLLPSMRCLVAYWHLVEVFRCMRCVRSRPLYRYVSTPR
jgi:hypothetical protein